MLLHRLLGTDPSNADVVLMMIEKYPAAVGHKIGSIFPILIECISYCRPPVIIKCIELYPETLNDSALMLILKKINQTDFRNYLSVISIVLTVRPESLYLRDAFVENDIRKDPYIRREMLNNMLPRHIFTPEHDIDYRDLNWQPRAAIMMLLSQVKMTFQCPS
jgi:hypothetical protein